MARHRPQECFKQLVTKLGNWLRYKFCYLAVRTFRFAETLDSTTVRSFDFESIDPRQEFSIAGHGREKFVIINWDKVISKNLFVNGSYDSGKIEKVISIAEDTNDNFKLSTLVDVGANIGVICIPAVKRGLANKAIAIEPEPLNYRLLVANIFLNDLADKIFAHNLALGCENNQTLEFELSPFNSGDHRIRVCNDPGIYSESTRKRIFVKTETFDSIISGVDRNDSLIWMDTQGYEGIILQGAQKAIQARIPMVIEFWPYGMKRANSYSTLKDAILKYRTYYDLSEGNPSPANMSESTIDRLYQRLGEGGSYTDILLI